MKYFIHFILISMFILAGCGANYQFKKAQRLEKDGYCIEAGVIYETIAKKYPQSPLAPQALYRLGSIYQKKLKMYSHAHRYFDELINRYPGSEPWTELGKQGLFNSPDYFPMTKGSFWIEGDSVSGGKNMRAEWNCFEVSTGTYRIQRRLSAGARLVMETNRYYRKQNLILYESQDSRSTDSGAAILSYPFITGKTWKTVQGGRTVVYTIIDANVMLNVKAGDFTNCLKISEEYPDLPGSRKYIYYAPEVGWVLTTTAGNGGQEHRNTELLSYKINPE